ncbi:D-hexose-6-phosphate mutarotase [Corynebacterium hylobatis]|uniref:glucose-6-phosphate 1-epimerase n=1 Tax=Corynebacterium hylobatis TaxID=1859290 RepID=A0A430HWW5_9CORY|nr:D-hexose-6-phosphate mutarotase [Corynebacterium hylobatis]RSZ62378.1 D-hexose-6-phosphate mutarotase [Corynebacterium hylobatis]
MDDLLTAGRMHLSPSGAHLTSTDTDLGELFWVSSTTGRSPIRGGVPVIAPAFADLLADAPRHGWARTADWKVTTDGRVFDAEVVNDGIHLLLHVRELADGVRLDLTARNESGEERTVQLGFHPYFRVSHVARVHVEGLDGVEVLDRLSDERGTQSGEVGVEGEFDRIFLASREVRIVDKQRVITVEAEGADATVVWNPGEKAAAGMEDVGGGEWADFLCVEPALLGADLSGVVLAPSQERRLNMTVRVSPSGS